MKRTLLFASVLLVISTVWLAPTRADAQPLKFSADLTGSAEVPSVGTFGDGNARFRVANDGQSIRYQLKVSDLDNVVQAHIHVGTRGENGPVVAFLFGPVEGGVTKKNLVANGVITEADLIPSDDFDGTLAELIQRMQDERTYVNVHTVAHPSGEIRGQITMDGR